MQYLQEDTGDNSVLWWWVALLQKTSTSCLSLVAR